jgi:hypothetical protein
LPMNGGERNVMLGNDVRWRVDRAFALKAIMQYLVNSKQKRITYKKIFAAHPLKGHNKEFDEVKRGHMFMRENAGFDIYEEEYPYFLIAAQKVIDDNRIELPAFLRETARHAGIRVAGGERSATIPYFIDVDGVAASMDKEMEEILRHYQGCWQVYRLSSGPSSAENGDRVNIGFLNIKPLELVRNLGLRVPEFSLYQRSEEDADAFQAANPGRVSGALLYEGGYVSLLGERAGRGFAKVGILTWAHVGNIFDEHETTIFGLSCIPNSEGRRMIGAYFIARFIPGSDEFNEEKYRATRDVELKRIGSVSWENLKERIEDQSLGQRIQAVFDRSKRDSLFQV